MSRFRIRPIALPLLLCALFLACPPSAFGQADAEVCEPACRSGYVCLHGACVSACNPPCGDGETCTSAGECIRAEATSATGGSPASGDQEGSTPSGSILPGATVRSVGVGPSLAEFGGVALDFEYDVGSPGNYFGVQFEVSGGRNGDSNTVVRARLAAGQRRYFGQEPLKFTYFLGVEGSSETEVEDASKFGGTGSNVYDYVTGGVRALVGLARFSSPSDSIGLEVGASSGYRKQVSGPFWDYSGRSTGFEGRLRFTFRAGDAWRPAARPRDGARISARDPHDHVDPWSTAANREG